MICHRTIACREKKRRPTCTDIASCRYAQVAISLSVSQAGIHFSVTTSLCDNLYSVHTQHILRPARNGPIAGTRSSGMDRKKNVRYVTNVLGILCWLPPFHRHHISALDGPCYGWRQTIRRYPLPCVLHLYVHLFGSRIVRCCFVFSRQTCLEWLRFFPGDGGNYDGQIMIKWQKRLPHYSVRILKTIIDQVG